MKRIIIGLVITGIAIGILSVSFIYSQTQEPAATQTSLPTVEDLIKKVEENVEKIQDLRADVKETEQEMNISKTEFSVKEVLKTREYAFLFKKPDMIKIIYKHNPSIPQNKEELDKFFAQHPDWIEEQRVRYFYDEYIPQVTDEINLGQATYQVTHSTTKLTDELTFIGPQHEGTWYTLLDTRKLYLVHNQLRKLLEPYNMQNVLTVKKDEKSPDVYIIEGTFKATHINREDSSSYGWQWETWEPAGDFKIEVKIDYKKGIILQSAWNLTDNFQLIDNNIWFPYKFSALRGVKDKNGTIKNVMTVIEFSNVKINKGIKDEEFYFENTKEYNIEKYRIKLLNEK
jgi:outer membrane lipoprotein-sorting protein